MLTVAMTASVVGRQKDFTLYGGSRVVSPFSP